MTRRVDFSSTNDMERVVEAAESLGAFPDLEDDVERLARDVFKTMRLNDPMRPTFLDAVKLGWMLAQKKERMIHHDRKN